MSKFTELREKITSVILPTVYGPDGLAEMLDDLGEQVTENEETQEELETKVLRLEQLLEPSYPGPDSSIEELHDEVESWNSSLNADIDQLSSVVDMLASAVSTNVKSLRSRISDLEQGLTVLYAQVQPAPIGAPKLGEITLSELLVAEDIDKAHDTALVMNQYPQTTQQFNDWVASQSSENVTFSSEA